MKETILRGEIYLVDFEPVRGSEQGGVRPALIIQNNIGNHFAPTVIVAPITSRRKPSLPAHLPISDVPALRKDSIVLLEQVRTLDKSRLGKHLGSVGQMTMEMVDYRLAVSLGISTGNYAPALNKAGKEAEL